MSKTALILALLLLSSEAQATTYAQIAIGGINNALMFVTNKTAFPWSGTVWLKTGYNQNWQGAWSVNGQNFTAYSGFTFDLAPHESRKFTVAGDSITRSGYCFLEADSSYSELDVAVSYFYEFRQNGVLVDSVGDSESAWGDGFILSVEKTALINTGIAWCPSSRYSSGAFFVVLTLYDSAGNVARSKTVTFNGHEAQFINQIFTDLPTNFSGHLRIDSQDYMNVTVLRMENTPTGFQFTSTPADDYIRF